MKTDLNEVLRYLGMDFSEENEKQVFVIASELEKRTEPAFVWKAFDLQKDTERRVVCLAGNGQGNSLFTLAGETAFQMLEDCEKAAVLVCTLGFAFERMLAFEQARDMSRAVILDACGSAYVEAGCNEAETEIASSFPGHYLSDRFSPGYGDLNLSLQKELLSITGAEKRLGIHLSDTMLMTPAKTVTAIVGISNTPQRAKIRGCRFCSLKENCTYRKAGTSCEK